MTRGVLILGAGGHGKVVADILRCQGTELLGFLDDDPAAWGGRCLDLPVLGAVDTFPRYEPAGLVLGIGANGARRAVAQRLGAAAAPLWVNAIHPRSTVAASARLGRGVVVAAGAIINPDSVAGDHAIINSGATVDHDTVIGAYAHVAPGAHLAGGVRVGQGALIGVGAAVIPYRSVGEWAIVGAGAVVDRDVPAGATAVGVPARWKSGKSGILPAEGPTRVPMSSPDITRAELDAVLEVMNSNYLSGGRQIERFESAVADYVGARHAVGVSSGTAGLHLSIIAAGVEGGDMAITSPFSFVASANCILYERGVPIFVDVDEATGGIDPARVAAAAEDLVAGGRRARPWMPPTLRDGGAPGRLKALLPVHVYGQPAEMEPIVEVARRHDLVVVEDACEALGSTYRGSQAGGMGDVGVFAFYPNKQLTTGEGGLIVTCDAALAELMRSLRNQGRDPFDESRGHTRLGYNYRLDELSAAVGAAQMERIEQLLAKRARVAKWYDERIERMELLSRPRIRPYTTRMSWFVYVVRVEPPASRGRVMCALREQGIPSRPYFTPIHLQPYYRGLFGYGRGDFPIAESLGDKSLALPFSSVMDESQVDQVCEALSGALRR